MIRKNIIIYPQNYGNIFKTCVFHTQPKLEVKLTTHEFKLQFQTVLTLNRQKIMLIFKYFFMFILH